MHFREVPSPHDNPELEYLGARSRTNQDMHLREVPSPHDNPELEYLGARERANEFAHHPATSHDPHHQRHFENHYHDRDVEHTSPYLRHEYNHDHFLVLEQSEDGGKSFLPKRKKNKMIKYRISFWKSTKRNR